MYPIKFASSLQLGKAVIVVGMYGHQVYAFLQNVELQKLTCTSDCAAALVPAQSTALVHYAAQNCTVQCMIS